MNVLLFKLALVFYPIFTFHYLGVHYAPITALILCVPGLLICLARLKSFNKIEWLFLFAAAAVVGVSLVQGFRAGYGSVEIMLSVSPVLVGIGTFFFISNLNPVSSERSVTNVIPWIHYFVLGVGLVEILCAISVLPKEVKVFVSEVASGVTSSRIQLLTREASWASIYLLTVIPFVYLYAPIYRRATVFLSVLLFLFIFSAYGFVCAMLAYLMGSIYRSKRRVAYVKKLFIVLLSIILSVVFLYQVAILLNEFSGGSYYTSRILKLSNASSLEGLVGLDGSVFLRVMYPYYAFDIFLQNPLGVGVSNYSEVFNKYIVDAPFSATAFSTPEIVADIYNFTADPRSFYTSIMIGGGVFSVIPFFFGIYFLIKRLKYIDGSKYRIALSYLLFVSLAAMFQLGSLAFFPFWLCAGLIVSSTKYKG